MLFKQYVVSLLFICFSAFCQIEKKELFDNLNITGSNENLKNAQTLLRIILINKYKNEQYLSQYQANHIKSYFFSISDEKIYFTKMIKACLEMHNFLLFENLFEKEKITQALNFPSYFPDINLSDQDKDKYKIFLNAYLQDIQYWVNNNKHETLQDEAIKINTLLTTLYNAQQYKNDETNECFLMVLSSIDKYKEQTFWDFFNPKIYFQKLAMKHFDIYAMDKFFKVINDKRVEPLVNKVQKLANLLLVRNLGQQKTMKGKIIFANRKKHLNNGIDIIHELQNYAESLYLETIDDEIIKIYACTINLIHMLQMYKKYKYKHFANGRIKTFERFYTYILSRFTPIIDRYSQVIGRVNSTLIVFIILPSLFLSFFFHVNTNTSNITPISIK